MSDTQRITEATLTTCERRMAEMENIQLNKESCVFGAVSGAAGLRLLWWELPSFEDISSGQKCIC